MQNKLKILLVEDSDSDADLLIRFLKKVNIEFDYLRVWQKEEFLEALDDFNADLVIADHTLPQFSGMEAFRLLKAKNKEIPFILVTGTVSEDFLMEYTKEGIDDYLLKENLLRLPTAIENVVNKKRIEQLHKRLELAYTETKDSINYAKIIQDAMLPDLNMLNRSFPNSLVMYRPKNTLSGDFYWFENSLTNFFIVVADCTGHGVPGSLLSMMGSNLLNEAVSIRKMTQPSEILARLNKRVRKILKPDLKSINDGMDIAFCTIDLTLSKLIYAGANRPLFIVRNRELLEFKPDKVSIGGVDNGSVVFKDHIIDVKQGDRVFLFSDGLTDQFHHKTTKKVTSKRVKELFTDNANLPFNEHMKTIIDFFDNWQGNSEQVDDVLFLSLQVP